MFNTGLCSSLLSSTALCALFALATTRAAAAEEQAILLPGKTIEIPDSTGKFDFLRIDSKRHRLLAAHENDGTSDFFDLDKANLITRLKTGGPVDTATDPDSKQYFVSVQEGQRVAIIDAATLKEVNSVKTDGPTDAILFEPKNGRVYVTHDDGNHVWVIDPKSAKVVGAVTIPGAPEFMVYDAGADRIFLAIKTTNEVVAIDPNTDTVVAHWPTGQATQPHGLALDASTHRLFAAGGDGKLVAIDTKTGKILSTVDIASKVDQIAFDPGVHQLYCTGPDWMTVLRVTPEGVSPLGKIKTAPTARNVAVDPDTHAVWTTYTDGKKSYARSWLPPR